LLLSQGLDSFCELGQDLLLVFSAVPLYSEGRGVEFLFDRISGLLLVEASLAKLEVAWPACSSSA
jgi:hypothetical protein